MEREGGAALEVALDPVLMFLAEDAPEAATEWRGWRVAPVGGGANNRLYRVTRGRDDLAVKFTIADDRDRAGREYAALMALRGAGLAIAPEPVLLARERYGRPVVVQTWLAGRVADEPPASDAAWGALLDHLAAVHTVTPAGTSLALPAAMLTARDAAEARRRIAEELARIPADAQPPTLRTLVARAERATFPAWPAPPLTLCRCDPNTSNFVRRDGPWASVDWENAGWGDPAFELADLLTHPKYRAVSSDRWDWVIEEYCRRLADPALATRIRAYAHLLLVWWAVRCARFLHDVPRGLDQRLAARPADWLGTMQAQYDAYLRRAHAALDGVGRGP
ncbi:MAG TPA: aminoglycoside phosphotransferase family protein [Thermomicrobiales bacterium]|nr:aminoglycoside phosphotransferase family protein [Thermomicrobiales bacterium]